MGMSTGDAKGTISEPNIVPLIDVLLVLIVIFLVITPKVPTGLPAVIPQPSPPQSKPNAAEPNAIVVQVTESGSLLINRERCDWDSLGARLSEIFRQRADKVAFVKGADGVSFAEAARAMDVMRGAGIEHIGLIAPNAGP